MSLVSLIHILNGRVMPGNPVPQGAELFYTSPTATKGYNAFGYPFQLGNGAKIHAFKKSADHAGQGDFAIAMASGVGLSANAVYYVRDGGGIIETSQGAFYRDAVNGYLYALTIDANTLGNSPNFLKVETYRILEADFISNPATALWAKKNTVDFTGYATDMVIGDLWGDVIQLPSGKVMVPIHLRNTSTNRHIALFIESTDAGDTWAIGSVILDKVGGGSFPSGSFSEVNPVVVEVGASDATTKIVVLIRNESYGMWTHVKSANGGATFTEDINNPFGYDFSDFSPPPELNYGSPSAIPISSKLYGGYVYSIIGYRANSAGLNKSALAVLRLSVSDFYDNPYTKASAQVTVLRSGTQVYNNVINGDQIHFGYPMLYIASGLWADWYDEHNPMSEWVDVNVKTSINQIKIAD